MEGVWNDVRHAPRMLRKNPGFAAVAVLTLALGIGSNTAIFSVISGVLLRPLPYPQSDRLIYINSKSATFTQGILPMSYPNYADFRAQNSVFEDIGITRNAVFNFSDGAQADRITGARVTTNLLRILRLQPHIGRDFTEEEGTGTSEPVALLAYGFWQQRFGGDAGVLGRTVGLDGTRYTIIGVLPPETRYPVETTTLWVPLIPSTPEKRRQSWYFRPIARLKDGVTLRAAETEMKTIAARLAQQYTQEYPSGTVELFDLKEQLVGQSRAALWILFGAVGCVLLIACANLANLLLARAAGRSSEVALRAALGADRGRLLRQFVTESMLLSGLGALLGLALAWSGVRALVGMAGAGLARASEVRIDGTVLAFTLALTVFTALLFGLFPAFRLSRVSLSGSLREAGGKGGTRGAAQRRALDALVVVEIAISLVLLTGAGLMLNSFSRLQNEAPGFVAEGAVAFEMGAAQSRYPSDADKAALYQRIVEKVRALPGVENAAFTNRLPLGASARSSYRIEGKPLDPGAAPPSAEDRAVSPGYFETMKIPILAGRAFEERDKAGSPDVVIVSRAFAQREWPGVDAVGKRLQFGQPQASSRWWEVVGVAGDVKLRSLDGNVNEVMYWVAEQNSRIDSIGTISLVVRSRTGAAIAPAVRAAIREVDSEQGVNTARPLETLVQNSVAPQRVNLTLLLIFAGIAAVLAAVGIYGVMSYSVTERTQEFGIRMALGAGAGDVMGMILRHGCVLVGLGVLGGIAGALALGRVMQSLLFKQPAHDPATFTLAALLLTVVSFAAIYLPARRATRVDPVIALRNE